MMEKNFAMEKGYFIKRRRELLVPGVLTCIPGLNLILTFGTLLFTSLLKHSHKMGNSYLKIFGTHLVPIDDNIQKDDFSESDAQYEKSDSEFSSKSSIIDLSKDGKVKPASVVFTVGGKPESSVKNEESDFSNLILDIIHDPNLTLAEKNIRTKEEYEKYVHGETYTKK